MKRDPFRTVLALLLFVSAALFVAGSIAEHHHSTAAVRPSVSPSATNSAPRVQASKAASPSAQPRKSATASKEGGSGSTEGSASHEATEHAAKHAAASSSPVPSKTTSVPEQTSTASPAEGSASREGAERAGKVTTAERVFGLDLERPGIVAAGTAVLVAVGVITLAWRRRWVLWGVGAVALAFTAFDIREAFHQSSEGRTSILAIAAVLAATHLAAAAVALVALVRNEGRPVPGV